MERIVEDVGEGGWIEHGDRKCRVVGRAERGGLRVDGGEGGFKERTISLLDIGWGLQARAVSEQQDRPLNEELVNQLRYLDGTPRGATRWIDTGWALVLIQSLPLGDVR